MTYSKRLARVAVSLCAIVATATPVVLWGDLLQVSQASAATQSGTLFVANSNDDTVSPVNTSTNAVGTPIGVGLLPFGVAITPDSKTVYVANYFAASVTPINVATGVAGAAISVGNGPWMVAVAPNGKMIS